MNEQNKKQVIIAAVLGIVLVGVLVYQLVLAKPPAPPSSGREAAAERAATTPARMPVQQPVPQEPVLEEMDIKAMIASVEVVPIDYPEVRIGRNPMAPLVGFIRTPLIPTGEGDEAAQETVVQLTIDMTASKVVSGIVWSERNPVAIVDDVVVKVGYVFPNGAQVHAIEPTRVLFKVGDTIIPVEMKEY